MTYLIDIQLEQPVKFGMYKDKKHIRIYLEGTFGNIMYELDRFLQKYRIEVVESVNIKRVARDHMINV